MKARTTVEIDLRVRPCRVTLYQKVELFNWGRVPTPLHYRREILHGQTDPILPVKIIHKMSYNVSVSPVDV